MENCETGVQSGRDRVLGKRQKGIKNPHNFSLFPAYCSLLWLAEIHQNSTACQAQDLTLPSDLSPIFLGKKSPNKCDRGEFWGGHCWFLKTFPSRQTSSLSVITVYHNIFFLKQLEISTKCSAVISPWKSSWHSLSLFLFHFREWLCSVLTSTAVK